ncbi:far upstream element-binding protein 2 isoform X2 [Bacillus rossius redtenbacheri]|uniref:far upstream element-binding protein 2 isoform X2 n=1 Tax=Bacillus rossius redtenbacheri TaxID=93214 RepID=UPI002FDE320E
MSDYSAVAPPTNFSQSSAFAAALQRARQIAAKINPGGAAAGDASGQKRPLEDGSGMDWTEPEAKKVAAVSDPAGAQLAALRAQQVTSPGAGGAAAQAAAQAAAVAARVAAAAAAGLQGLGVGVSIGPVQNEDIRVPDKMVGLIIGRGGEQITRLQNESGCKIQMAPDSGGMPERVCTLTGSRDSINRAKELIMNIVQQRSRTEGVGPGMGDMNMGGGGGPGNHSHHVLVPRAAVGVVIGKGGDMIKKIQNETGARVQFQQGRDDGPGERRCLLTGKPNQVEQARRRIEELIDSVLRRDSEIGRGRGRGGPGGPPFDRMGRGAGGGDFGNGGWDRRPGGMQQGGQMDKQEATATFTIPAAKCGIVIGRGGETIKQINQQTGAHCELDRRPSANPAEKIFVIRGAPDQIEQAKRIISEKIGMSLMQPPGPGGPPAQYPMGQGPPGGQGPPQHFAPQGWGGGGYQPWQNQQHPNDPNAPGGGGGGQVQVNPATGQPDYSIQWAEYYRSLGMHREAEMIEQQAKQAMQPQQPQPAAPQQPQPAAATQNGQPDYSAQWAEYYRSIGKIKEAEAIEAQMKAGKPGGGGGPPGPQQPQPQPGPGPQQPGPGPQQPQQPAYGQPYGYQATSYYGAAPGPQPPPQSQQPYNYPNYGGYGAQPGGPENQ